jgi:hypothetical protein
LRTADALRIGDPFARSRGLRPGVLQWLFVVSFAGFWITTANISSQIGRPETALTILGLAAVPFAKQGDNRISFALPLAVTAGIVGLLGTYILAFLANSPDDWGTTFVIALAGRVAFMWIAYILLQNRMLLHRAYWLLVASSCAAAAWALVVTARYGMGVGRTSTLNLQEWLGTVQATVFSSAQMAPVGAILLLSATPYFGRRLRVAAGVISLSIFFLAYASFFRRELLITVPILLVALQVRGAKVDRRIVLTALIAVLGGVIWEFSRETSVLHMRMREEGVGFISRDETRVTTAKAQLQAVIEAPILGYGAGNHASAIGRYAPATEYFLSGFNIYGWLAVEGGVLCLVSYLVILWHTFRISLRPAAGREDSPEAAVIRAGPILVLQVGLWGLFGNAWEVPLAWFLLGMVLAAAEISRHRVVARQPYGGETAPLLLNQAPRRALQ